MANTYNSRISALIALTAFSMAPMSSHEEVTSHGAFPSYPEPINRGFRKGRRFAYIGRRNKNGDNPAGTKLAKKAAKGKLTLCGIR